MILSRTTQHVVVNSYVLCGLPCACELLAYLNSGDVIPLDSVDIFWRTLDVSWSTPLEHEDIQCDDELHIFKETFNKQSNAGKKSLLRRLDLNEEPCKTRSLCESVIFQTRCRGDGNCGLSYLSMTHGLLRISGLEFGQTWCGS
ncbi:hypothetical protein Tco_1238700 [Tanacetum coccineum]